MVRIEVAVDSHPIMAASGIDGVFALAHRNRVVTASRFDGVGAVAGGYRMSTKPEHHEAVRAFVKSLKPPLKLSLPALETLAVIAYRQPVTRAEIEHVRGVDAATLARLLAGRYSDAKRA